MKGGHSILDRDNLLDPTRVLASARHEILTVAERSIREFP